MERVYCLPLIAAYAQAIMRYASIYRSTASLTHLEEWLMCEEAVVSGCTDRYAVPLPILIQEVDGGGE